MCDADPETVGAKKHEETVKCPQRAMPARRHPAHKRGTKLRVDYSGKTYAAKYSTGPMSGVERPG